MTEQQPEPRPTHVVTNILRRVDITPHKILLVRRSQRVGSYQSHWAGVSGFVEPNVTPDEQAYTEIREETGLQRDQIRMLQRGKVVEYIDAELGRHWYIHPFLFEVLTPDAIKTDWEATEMRWIEPSELVQYETVPKLQEVYDSAIHGVGGSFIAPCWQRTMLQYVYKRFSTRRYGVSPIGCNELDPYIVVLCVLFRILYVIVIYTRD